MKSPTLIKALREAKILDSIRAVFVEYPSLEEVVQSFCGYLSLVPAKVKGGRPLLVDCLSMATNEYQKAKRMARHDSEVKPQLAFVSGMLHMTPTLLQIRICAPSHIEHESVCWVPFAESISDFCERYPLAEQYEEPCAARSSLTDAQARELVAARVLPATLAKFFIRAAEPSPEVSAELVS